jgi:hypothetical protein
MKRRSRSRCKLVFHIVFYTATWEGENMMEVRQTSEGNPRLTGSSITRERPKQETS